jgi:hypothetical protein
MAAPLRGSSDARARSHSWEQAPRLKTCAATRLKTARSIAFPSPQRHDDAMSFRLREWFLLLVVVCLALGWLVHSRCQSRKIKQLETRLESIEHVQRPFLVYGDLAWRDVKELEDRLRVGDHDTIVSMTGLRNGDVEVYLRSEVQLLTGSVVDEGITTDGLTVTITEHRIHRLRKKDEEWEIINTSQWQE